MSMQNRRYRVVAGNLEKAWHGRDDDGWVKSKAEAFAAAQGAVAEPAAIPTAEPLAAPDAPCTPVRRGPGRPRKADA